MRIYGALAAAAAATVMVSMAMAAESDRFVVKGDAAKQLLEQNSINIATASAFPSSISSANRFTITGWMGSRRSR
jgi:hypothetical protein